MLPKGVRLQRSGLKRVAVVGNYTPRQCGIATFTADLSGALAARPETDVFVVAMNDRPEGYVYPERVRHAVAQHDLGDYGRTADFLNLSGADLVCLQHEFGIFGGPAGSYILSLLRELNMPVVTTLHTVLDRPDPAQRRVMDELCGLSSRLVVMSARGADFLRDVYGVPDAKISLVHHGIPDAPFAEAASFKAALGVTDEKMLLTFGLLSQNKGVETVIEALPEIVSRHPEVVYTVLGTTHPHVLAHEGERYRESLVKLAGALGVGEHIRFDSRFLNLDELIRYIGAADVYITPYLNREQITSGTLAYALGLGKAVVSTPYWYAEELLAEGRGVLVPFRDAGATAAAVNGLFDDDGAREALRARAYAHGRTMTWPSVARAYREVFAQAAAQWNASASGLATKGVTPPPLNLGHLLTLTDDTGILQHATFTVPNRHEGYTTDDNARALTVAALAEPLLEGQTEVLRDLCGRYLAFLIYAFDASTGRFRNFMSYERAWLEPVGSENAHARALRALATLLRYSQDRGQRGAAEGLFERALPALATFSSPRAWALGLLAVAERLDSGYGAELRAGLREVGDALAARLVAQYEEAASPDWPWFETLLSYSNAKLPHGLLAYGRVSENDALTALGLDTLSWLLEQQRAPEGHAAPIGSDRVYWRGGDRPPFDQQPIEAYATVSACLEAYRATRDARLYGEAEGTFAWFLGRNDLGLPLYDPTTGGCRDGLHPDRTNENQGAESTLSFLLASLELKLAGRPKPELAAGD